MATGRSIHIGLNSVDPDGYDGWDGPLVACEFDANDMAALAEGKGFETQKLLTKDATSSAVLDAIGEAASALSADDILFVSYSGHGSQLTDTNTDEDDQMDETWCAFDRQIADDELYAAWAGFPAGARIFVLSDSCHSGSAIKVTRDSLKPEALDGQPRSKAMPLELRERAYQARKAEYDEIQQKVPTTEKSGVEAHVLLISGCQDNQTSADGDKNGLFTQTLLKVWDEGSFRGSYRSFAKKIVAEMPPWQAPNFFSAGAPSREFEREQPFTL